jgi:hypothetical protein
VYGTVARCLTEGLPQRTIALPRDESGLLPLAGVMPRCTLAVRPVRAVRRCQSSPGKQAGQGVSGVRSRRSWEHCLAEAGWMG